ncbi:MAG: 16S rRNA (uracil(1498)-N(3))-methyltransferase [Anaerolineae bacterium]|nr:16S rRNA (uracil(1498)-N(3))-methyltransferase [Anaerolineae bacterium]
MHRFFVPPEWIGDTHVVLLDAVARQVRTVLRMRPGDHVIVLDNAGSEIEIALVEIAAKEVTGEIIARRPATGEPRVAVTLIQALLKKDKFEWVLQKCTEIGATAFMPVESQRCVVPLSSINDKKLTRWQRIITEAAEQSRRGRIPTLHVPQTLPGALANTAQYDRVLIPWEDAQSHTLRDVLTTDPTPTSVAICIGPEGGFGADEIAAAQEQGAIPVTLGPRILRAETAAIAAVLLTLDALGAMTLPA